MEAIWRSRKWTLVIDWVRAALQGPRRGRTKFVERCSTQPHCCAERGVAQVSLRDVATAANTHLGLIGRYIGDREELSSRSSMICPPSWPEA